MGTRPSECFPAQEAWGTEKDLDWTPPLPLTCSIPMAMYSHLGYAPAHLSVCKVNDNL